jgi:hypothetical protein
MLDEKLNRFRLATGGRYASRTTGRQAGQAMAGQSKTIHAPHCGNCAYNLPSMEGRETPHKTTMAI